VARIAALFLVVFGLLPIANWIPGGHEAPWYGEVLRQWAGGAAMLLLLGVLAFVLSRRRMVAGNRPPAWERLAVTWDRGGVRNDVVVAVLVGALAAAASWFLFSARPLLIDEIIQVFQARVFAGGQLALPSPALPEFSSSTHMLDLDGRRFGQFPPGWSLWMAPFAAAHLTWLAGPVATAITVFLFARLMRQVETSPATRSLAVALFALAPFALFLGASHMNHMATLGALLGAALAVSHLMRPGGTTWWWAFAAGLCLGVAATIRPLDAVAFALPTAGWLLWRAGRDRGRWPELAASGAGIALPLAALLWYNGATTGSPLLFGYVALWGPSHGLGFHEVPWGPAHSVARGIELVNLYLLRLQSYLFEMPVPSLLAATAALGLTRKITAFDRWLLASVGLVLCAYFAYWHDGNFLGPRFVLPLVPAAAWWSARLPGLLRERGVAPAIRRAVGVAAAGAVVIALATDIPLRATTYANGLQTMRWNPDVVLDRAEVVGPILVRESWGAELLARLRATGITATDAERTYRSTDACDLDHELTRIEALPPAAQASRIGAFQASQATAAVELVPMPTSPDSSLRWRPGHQLDPLCRRRLAETVAGFTLYSPLLLSRSPERFVRDLHARDTMLFESGAEPRWLLIGDPIGAAGPRLVPVDGDSLRREWYGPLGQAP
jgi:hypothetical protein